MFTTQERNLIADGFVYAFFIGFCALVIAGCGYSQYAGETKISWPTTHGPMEYYNNRDYQGLEATGNPEKGNFKVKLETSKSNEQAVAAAAAAMAQAQANLTEIVKELLPLIKAAAATAVTKVPIAPVVPAPTPTVP